jgi:hypothetical protein
VAQRTATRQRRIAIFPGRERKSERALK